MRENNLRLIELAFDYVSAETESQAKQVYNQAALLAGDKSTLRVWIDLVAYMEEWNQSLEHKSTMSRASALQFFSARQAELKPAHEQDNG